jgi:hypothetical protein
MFFLILKYFCCCWTQVGRCRSMSGELVIIITIYYDIYFVVISDYFLCNNKFCTIIFNIIVPFRLALLRSTQVFSLLLLFVQEGRKRRCRFFFFCFFFFIFFFFILFFFFFLNALPLLLSTQVQEEGEAKNKRTKNF